MAPVDQRAAAFDHNDHAMRARCAAAYAELRDQCPVFHSEAWGGFWVASRYEDVYEVGRDVERFASAPGVMLPPVGHGRPLLPMDSDPPEHPEYKRLMLPRFAPAAVAGMEQDVRDLARGLVEDIVGRGEADLYETLCKPLPMLLITRLLGIERDDAFWAWTDTLIYGRVDGTSVEEIRGAADSLYAFLAGQIAERRAAPGRDDLISLLLRGDVEGRPYREDEILDLCFFLLIAGLENTSFGIRATLRHLAVEPAHRAAVLADPSLVHNLVEQSLRLYSPVTALCRTATRDTEVAGRAIGKGERVLLLFGSANRDPAVFPDADAFHLDRRDGRHVAFGIGPHRCVGSNLARLEMRVAVEEMLRLIPDYRLAAGPDPGWYDATCLNVVWDVTGGAR
jgi:cytochrome P450